MITNSDVTIHDFRIISQTRDDAKKEALKLMLKGDLKNYFQKLVEISQLEEFSHKLAA